MSHARSALALALGWALLEILQRKTLNPLRRQTITHDPRIGRALGTTQNADNLGNTDTFALAHKVHDRIQKEKCTMCKKRLALRCTLCSLVSMNSTKTEYASKQLEALTVGFTKIVNGKSVTRWSVNRWEVGTFGKNEAMNLTETLVELGFDVE